eukprot:1391441-Amorphochlora_amoeboformis.AAC.3
MLSIVQNAEDIHYFDAKTERSSFRRPPQMEKAIKDAGMDIEALRKDDKDVRTWLKNLAPANTHRPGKRIRSTIACNTPHPCVTCIYPWKYIPRPNCIQY